MKITNDLKKIEVNYFEKGESDILVIPTSCYILGGLRISADSLKMNENIQTSSKTSTFNSNQATHTSTSRVNIQLDSSLQGCQVTKLTSNLENKCTELNWNDII